MANLDISNGLRVNGQFPLDSRVVAANEAARYAIPAGAVYEGLVVYEESTKKLFLLDEVSNANNIDGWTEIPTGSSGTGGQSETSYFQSGAGGSLQETFWIGTKGQYDARSDEQKSGETIHYITDDLTLVTGAGENTQTYLLTDFGITSTAAQIDHAAQELEGISLSDDIATANSTTVFTNKSGAISQWTNDAGYLTNETSHADVVDSGSTVTVNADSTQTNGGSVDANGNLTVNVDLPDLSLLITRANVLNDDFDPTGLWDFRNANVLIEGVSADVTKTSIDEALQTSSQSANRFYSSNNGGSWQEVTLTIDDGTITIAKLDSTLQTTINSALTDGSVFATSTQGQTADSALQPADVEQFAKDTTTRLTASKLPSDTVYDADISDFATNTQINGSTGKVDKPVFSGNYDTGAYDASVAFINDAALDTEAIGNSGIHRSGDNFELIGNWQTRTEDLNKLIIDINVGSSDSGDIDIYDTDGEVVMHLDSSGKKMYYGADINTSSLNTDDEIATIGDIPNSPSFSVSSTGLPASPTSGQEVYIDTLFAVVQGYDTPVLFADYDAGNGDGSVTSGTDPVFDTLTGFYNVQVAAGNGRDSLDPALGVGATPVTIYSRENDSSAWTLIGVTEESSGNANQLRFRVTETAAALAALQATNPGFELGYQVGTPTPLGLYKYINSAVGWLTITTS